MKRTNAQRITDEKTDSAAVREKRFRDALRAFEEEAAKGNFFHPGYAEEIAPISRSVLLNKKTRVSADEKREPRKKSRKRGTR